MPEMYYQSLTMGNIIETRREVIAQIISSLFRYHTLDLRWRKVGDYYEN